MSNPNIGKFVRCLNNDLGIGKVIDSNAETALIEYFDSPVSSTWPRFEAPVKRLRAVKLDEQTRVYFFDEDAGCWKMGRVHAQVDDEVFVDLPNKQEARVDARRLFVRWNLPLVDPWEHLTARLTETPYFHAARTGLVAHLVRQRAASMGMVGLLSTPISLQPHQIEVVRRVLTDPVQRYLLADEVGLGKTIEAGVILRQHILDHPHTHNILVLTPGSLTTQWESELTERCQIGEPYGHRVKVCAIEDIAQWKSEQPNFIVVDEAHQLSRGANDESGESLRLRFAAIRRMSAPEVCPNLLLLSATPVLRNERGFLALLHLLDPAVYSMDDAEAFQVRVATRQELADLFAGFTEDQQPFFLEGMADQLTEMFPSDRRLSDLVAELRPLLDSEDGQIPSVVRRVRMHLSETYRLHRRLLRNRRNAELAGLLPGRRKLVAGPWSDQGYARAEEFLDQWRARAAASVWGREESDDARCLAGIFILLLEALWSDPLAFLHFVKVRQYKRSDDLPEKFGCLRDDAKVRFLTYTPTFEGEDECLQAIVEIETRLIETRDAYLRTASQFVRALLSKGFRVVCMATCPSVADDFYQVIVRRHPEWVIRHSPTKHSWRDAWDREGPQALVCDASAEEGVNLQGGNACILHLDLPLAPNRIEQRMGRLDRFGVAKSVFSYVLQPEGASFWIEWSRCLDNAWRVFSRSIAALQYVVEDEMLTLERQMFLNGVDALKAANERLSSPEGIERELKFIRNQDELDAIESEAVGFTAELAERIEQYECEVADLLVAVERWFVDCLHFVRVGEGSPDDSVLRYHFARPERGRRTLLPTSGLQRWFMDAFDSEANHPHFGPPLTHALTYGRETARRRRVGLARLGNPVIDAISEHLTWDDRGTSFAMWRQTTAENAGIFFRLDYIIEADISSLGNEAVATGAVQRQADAAFPPIIETLWISQDLMEPDVGTRAILQQPYGGEQDANVNAERWPKVLDHVQCNDWSGLCASVRSVAEQLLRARRALGEVTERCARAYEQQCATTREVLLSRLEGLPPGRSGEREQLQRELEESARRAHLMASGIRRPVVRIDAAGVLFLSERRLEDLIE